MKQKQFLDFPIIEGKQNKHDKLLLVLLAESTFHEGVRYLKKENINASQLAKKVGKARSYKVYFFKNDEKFNSLMAILAN